MICLFLINILLREKLSPIVKISAVKIEQVIILKEKLHIWYNA